MNRDAKRIVKIVGFSIFFLFVIVYGFFRSKNLILGVKINNVNIVDGSKTMEGLLKISGNAKNAIFLSLDDREISINQKGDFSETIALSPGYNIIKIRAEDKFGHVDEKNYKLIYEAETSLSDNLSEPETEEVEGSAQE